MSDLVSIKAAIKFIDLRGHDLGLSPTWKENIKEYLRMMPTVDAVPVVHGRWIEKEDGVTHCSECDRVGNSHIDHYCPRCGAKMDEREV